VPLVAARTRASVIVAYVAFALTGVSASVAAVVLPAQIADYDVDRATIGITFFTFSAAFFLAGATTGWLMERCGTRVALLVGSGAYVVGALVIAARPSFLALVLLQVLTGYGTGIIESVLQAYLAGLPAQTARLNLLHGFFGVGALVGPLAATWIVERTQWTVVYLLLGLVAIPVAVAYALTLPGRAPAHVTGAHDADDAHAQLPSGRLLGATLRQTGVVLAAVFLTVYVGLEMSMGNWGVNYLVEHHDLTAGFAGGSVSGYWLGLTVGRFVISPAAGRLRWTVARMTAVCLLGVVACGVLVSLSPVGLLATGGFVLLGFFLGPLFPTAVAVVPELTSPRLVPTAIGLLNAVSVIGGSALPWLVGALGDAAGIWVLMPFVTALGVVQLLLWRGVVLRMRDPRLPAHLDEASRPEATTTEPSREGERA
jgi:fucose permease